MKNYVKSFLINFISFIFIIICFGCFAETNDDLFSSFLFQNNSYPNPFIRNFIGYISNFINFIIPNINGFILFQIILSFLISCDLSYLILKKYNDTKIRIPLLIIVIIVVLFENTYQEQFTKTSILCVVCGIIHCQMWLNNKNKKEVIIGIGLLLIGFGLRFNTIIFLIIPYCLYLLFNDTFNLKQKLALLLLPILISSFSFGLSKIEYFYANEDCKEYMDFNNSRSKLVDFILPNYDRHKTEYDNLNISKNDTVLISKWFIGDNEIFSKKNIEDIGKISKNKYDKIAELKVMIGYYILYSFLFFISILTILLMIVCFRKEKRKLLLYFLGILFEILLLVLTGRIAYRLVYSLFLPYLIITLFSFEKIKLNNKQVMLFITSIIILFVSFNCVSSSVILEKYSNSTKNYKDVISYIEKNSQDKFFALASLNDYENFSENALTKKYLPNCINTSWNLNSQIYKNQLKNLQIENPVKDLITKDNYYIVDFKNDNNSVVYYLSTYFKEHYNKDIEIKEIKEFSQSEQDTDSIFLYKIQEK